MTSRPADHLITTARAHATAGAWGAVRALLSEHAADTRAHSELVTMLAEAHLRARHPRDAGAWLGEMLPLLERRGDRAELRRAINLLGAAHFELGELADAEAAFGRALELGRLEGDDLLVARATNNLALIADIRAQREEALALLQLAVPAYQRLGHARGLAETYHNMAIAYRHLGQLERADEHERRAIEFATEAGSARLAAMARVGRAEVSLRRGDAPLAWASARFAAREFAAIPDPVMEADALRLCAVAATLEGRHADARALAVRALELARAHGNALIEAEALRARAEISVHEGDRAAALADAEAAMEILTRMNASEARRELAQMIAELRAR